MTNRSRLRQKREKKPKRENNHYTTSIFIVIVFHRFAVSYCPPNTPFNLIPILITYV